MELYLYSPCYAPMAWRDTSLPLRLFVWGLYNEKDMSHVLFTYLLVVLDIIILKLTIKDTAYNVICQKRWYLNLNVIKYSW
jgi:hypothetical protein